MSNQPAARSREIVVEREVRGASRTGIGLAVRSTSWSAHGDATFAQFKERTQRRQVIFTRPQRNRVDVVAAKRPRQLLRLLTGQIAESRSCTAVGGVDFNLLTGFSV